MLGRGFFGVISVIGLLVLVGLLVTHSSGATAVENATFSGVGALIRDLQLQPQSGTHK